MDKQLSFLTAEQNQDVLEQSEYSQGIYSGKQLKHSNPEQYETVCMLLADGSQSQRQIAKLCGVSRNLVSGISRQSPDIEPLKKKIANRARQIATLSSERLEEMLLDPSAKISAKDLGIIFGIAVEKSQVLSGGATERREVVITDPGFNSYSERIAALRSADVQELPARAFAGRKFETKGIDGPDVLEPAAKPEGAGNADKGAEKGLK